MAKRLSIYVSDAQEERYAQIQMRAEAVGKTLIDYLLTQDEEFEKLNQAIKKMNKKDRKGYEVYTMSLGYDQKDGKKWLSFYGKCLYSGVITSNDTSVQVYEGVKGKILVWYALSESESRYTVVDNREDAMKEILDIPTRLLEAGYELDEEDFDDLKEEYVELTKEACEAVGVPLIGEDVLNIEF